MVGKKIFQLFSLTPLLSAFIYLPSCSHLPPGTTITTMFISGDNLYAWDYKKYSVHMPTMDFTKAPYTNTAKDSLMINDLGNKISANCFINSIVFTVRARYPNIEGWTLNALKFRVIYNSIKHNLSIDWLLDLKNADEINFPERSIHWWTIKPAPLFAADLFVIGANELKTLWFGQLKPEPIYEDAWFKYENRDKDGKLLQNPNETWAACDSFYVYPTDWHDVKLPSQQPTQ